LLHLRFRLKGSSPSAYAASQIIWRGLALLGPGAGPVLLMATVTVALFAPYLVHPDWLIWPRSGLGADIVHLAWPDLATFSDALGKGNLTLWNDSTALGHPAVGNLGTLWLYPFTFLFLILPPAWAFTWMAVLHIFLAGLFTYWLAHALFPVSRLAATVSALTFMLMPKLIAHLAGGHVGMIYGLAWMPAVLLGARVSIQSRRLWPAALGGIAFALQLPGHPQIPVATIYIVVGMLGWHCWQALAHSGWRSRELRNAIKQAVAVGLVIGCVAATLGAIWWMPTAELLPWTTKIEFDTSVPFWYQIPPGMLLSLFAPTDFQFPEWTIYVGIVPLFLALIALMGERRRTAVFLWTAVGLSLMLALGDATLVYPLARWMVPGLGFFRTTTRLWLLGAFVVALLAGLGVDALGSRATWARIERNRRWLKLAGVACVLGGAIAVPGLGLITRKMPAGPLWSWSLGILLLVLLWFGWRRWPASTICQAALLGLLLLDLFPVATGFMMGIEPRQTFLKPDPVIEFVAAQGGDYRVYSPHRNLSYALAAERGIESIDGIINLQLARSVEIIKVASGCRLEGYAGGIPPCLTGEIDTQAYRTATPDPAVLGLLNVRYVIADFPLDVPGLTLVFTSSQVTVFENSRLLPRAFLVGQVATVQPGESVFEELTRADLAHTALIGPEAKLGLTDGPLEGEARIESRSAGHIRLTTRSNREALLVYSQAWAPGWRATVDGRPTPVARVDGALIGLVIPAGAGHITLDYVPFGWQVSWPISLLAVVALAAWGSANWLGRRAKRSTVRGI
jgi:hypothetical protein